MKEQTSVLVSGIDETASAVARMLFLEGYAVAIHQPVPPKTLRRRMAFSDAWYDGAATLDGIEARRVDLSTDFLVGMRNRMFIPVLAYSALEAERWPWDVIVDADAKDRSRDLVHSQAAMTIVLGPGAIAGTDCDLVIETGGPNAGAIIHKGSARGTSRQDRDRGSGAVFAAEKGLFSTERLIGETVAKNEPLATINASIVVSPMEGRIRGLQRRGRAVITGDAVADIVPSPSAQVSGCGKGPQLIARGVVFALETEFEGLRPVALDHFLRGRSQRT